VIAESRSPRIPPFFGATYSPDGTKLVALATGNAIDVLDARSLQPVGGQPVAFTPPEVPIRYAYMTPDGHRAMVVLSAIDHDDTRVAAIDLDRRQVLYATGVDIPHAGKNASPDGHTVALVSKNTGKVGASTRHRPEAPINSPDTPPLSRSRPTVPLVTADRRRRPPLDHRPRSSARQARPPRRRRPHSSVGRVLIAYRQRTFQWDTNPNAWESTPAPPGRNLTQAEWATLFPNRPYQATCPQYAPGA
jgi:hypothetical protein